MVHQKVLDNTATRDAIKSAHSAHKAWGEKPKVFVGRRVIFAFALLCLPLTVLVMLCFKLD